MKLPNEKRAPEREADRVLREAEAEARGALTLNDDGSLAECPCCGEVVCTVEIRARWMHTQYHDVRSNIMVSCLSCFEYSESLWDEMWADYYAGLL